ISTQAPFVKKYPLATHTLDGDGRLTLDDLEFDTYTIVLQLSTGDITESVYLAPNTNQQLYLSPHRLTFTVESSTGVNLTDAIVQLTRTDVGYDETDRTDLDGELTFTSLRTGTYGYVISLDGYDTATGNVD